jgi:beta-glucuronidase
MSNVNIPSCVDNTPPGYLGYRGVSVFKTQFQYDLANANAPARLVFQACSFYCRIWVNGIGIGDHRTSGYVAFMLYIPLQQQQITNISNELIVLVDNRFNKTTAPTHTPGDYWHYSGIMRSVEMHAMPTTGKGDIWPWRMDVLLKPLSTVAVTLYLTDPSYEGPIKGPYFFDDEPAHAQDITGQASRGVVHLGVLAVPNPRLWNVGRPQLHTITIDLNGATVTERFGLRQFGIDNATSRITANGDIIKLVGWNHHIQWPNTAASPTDQDMDDDMELLLQAGTNFVRGVVVPQDPRWLDRMDEAGVVMWSETLGMGVTAE